MTIKQARQILGKQAKGISDTELEHDIEIAELLKNLFFSMVAENLKKTLKSSSKARSNVP